MRLSRHREVRLICERVPGWEALEASVAPEGAVVLLGERPSADERRRMGEADREIAWSAKDALDALGRAESRAKVRRTRIAPERLAERAEAMSLVNEMAQAIALQGD